MPRWDSNHAFTLSQEARADPKALCIAVATDGWSFYNGWAGPVLDWLSERIHYSDPRVLALTFGVVNNLPLMLLVARCVIGAHPRPGSLTPRLFRLVREHLPEKVD